MTVKQDNSFIFVCNPRTGTHYIRDWLQKAFKDTEELTLDRNRYVIPHDTHIPIVEVDKKTRNRYFKWGVVRNPFDFYVSWWAGFRADPPYSEFNQHFEGFMRDMMGSEVEYHNYINFNQMKGLGMGLATFWFIRMFCDYHKLFELSPRELAEADLSKELLVDYVVHYEKMTEEIPEMFAQYMKPLTKEQISLLEKGERITASEHNYFASYYTPELIEIVKQRDKLIFDIYPEYARMGH